MTLAEFLAWDDGTDQRYELLFGEVIAMAPALEAHGTIVARLAQLIGNALRRPCRVVTEVGIQAPGRKDTFFIPDLAVTCAPPQPKNQFLVEPTLIVEVLSPSTAHYDRQFKLTSYRQTPSVREILYVSSFERQVELQRRGEAGLWTVEDLIGGGTVRLQSVPVDLPLDAIYQDVALGDGS